MKNMNLKRFLAFVILFLCSVPFLLAQGTMNVTGKVVDIMGEPMIGVSILEKGTNNGVITDIDGNYSLSVNKGSTIVFSYIGYTTQELRAVVGTLNVTLKEDSQALEEVVVVGYGVQKKSDVTGAISKLTSEDMETRSITRAEQALQGKTSGIQIINSSAAPGSTPTIRVRGFSSNYTSDPLYIIDGLRVSDISGLDPNDIESMEVLKDAASAAIYGAEAGNGVVLITTKKAKKGGVIQYDFQYVMQSLANLPKVMNADQYKEYIVEGGWITQEDLNTLYDGVTNTNWADEAFETSIMQKHNVSLQLGGERHNFYASLSYLDNDGIVKGESDSYKRYTGTINADAQIKSWLKVGTNTSFDYSKMSSVAEQGTNGLLAAVMALDPLTPVAYEIGEEPEFVQTLINAGKALLKNENGQYYGLSQFHESEIVNPFITRDKSKNQTESYNLRSSLYANVTPFEGLTLTSRFGLNVTGTRQYVYDQKYYANSMSENATLNVSESAPQVIYYQWENFANYMKSIGLHNIGAMLGVSYSSKATKNLSASTNAITKEDPNYAYLDFSTTDAVKTVAGSPVYNRKFSYFGRLNYSYDEKYLLQFSLRADAADLSVLPIENRWGYYPAASVGWVFSKEKFFPQIEQWNYAKLRASWGQNGSISNLSDYMWNNAITSSINYPMGNDIAYSVGSYPSTLGNRNLRWETSEQFDLGVDLRFFNDRLSVTADYYIKKTKDLIMSNVNQSLTAGNDPSPINAGNVENKGFELELSWRDHIGDFKYSISGNLATVKNKVTNMPDAMSRIDGAMVMSKAGFTAFETGYPVWYFRGYVFDHIDQETGDPVFKDVNGNGTFDADDVTMIGSAIPDFTYGLTLNASYKNFDLTVFGTGSQGNDIYNGLTKVDRTKANRLEYYYINRWTPENPTASTPRAGCTNEMEYFASSAAIFDGSYFKIKQIQLGYTFPSNLLKKTSFISSARIYASLDDWFTFTSYPGFDPEASSGATTTLGIDNGSYPTSKKVVFGINVTF